MEYINLEELELFGTHRSYGWSITKLGTKCEEYYLSLNLFITNDWQVSEDILEHNFFHYIENGMLHDYITKRLDKMIDKLTKAMEKHRTDKLDT